MSKIGAMAGYIRQSCNLKFMIDISISRSLLAISQTWTHLPAHCFALFSSLSIPHSKNSVHSECREGQLVLLLSRLLPIHLIRGSSSTTRSKVLPCYTEPSISFVHMLFHIFSDHFISKFIEEQFA